MNVVARRPILSVRMPETGDRKNVVPSANEPTKAANERKKMDIYINQIELHNDSNPIVWPNIDEV